MTIYNDTVSETAVTTAAVGLQALYDVSDQADGVRVSPVLAPVAVYPRSLTQRTNLLDRTSPIKQAIASLSVGTGIGSTLINTYAAGAIVQEVVRWQATITPAAVYKRLLADTLALTQRLLSGTAIGLTETLRVHDAVSLALGVVVVQGLYLSETPGPSAIFAVSLLQGLATSGSLQLFLSGALSEGLGIGVTSALTYRADGTLAEDLELAATLAPQFILVAKAQDGVEIGAADALNMVFSGVIAEGIELGIAFAQPGGAEPSITTWAINTRTNAVTEYDNFQFDSFTQVGHKYLGGNRNGLYELEGATDDGANIVARLKSGLLQIGGTKLTGFKAVYLGMRTVGDYVLRLETGDGRTYDYMVKTQNMLTTKVNLGKGLRARYFSFELIGTGADMDLDSIEFVPVVMQRRV